MRLINLFLTAIFLLIIINTSYASERPLRLWIMNNDAETGTTEVSEEEIISSIKILKKDGITIENSISNLLIPSEHKYPLAFQIIKNKNFVRQLAKLIKENPEIGEVSIEFVRWDDAYIKIFSTFASKNIETYPDILQVGLSWGNELADAGKLVLLEGMFNRDNFYPAPLITSSIDSPFGFYAVPWFVEMRLLYYHKNAVENESEIADWNSFLNTCKQYKERTGKPFIGFSTSINWNLLHNFVPWLWSAGGDLVENPSGTLIRIPRVTIANKESINAMIYLKRLSESGCAEFLNLPQEALDKNFANEKYGAIVTGPWITNLLGNNWNKNIGLQTIPEGAKGSLTFMGGSHLVISKASIERGNLARAISLVKLLTSEKAQNLIHQSTGLYPVQKHSMKTLLSSFTGNLLKDRLINNLSYPHMPQWGEIIENEFIKTHLWLIWRNIAQTVSDETLIATVNKAKRDLNLRIASSQAQKFAPHISIILILFIITSLSAVMLSRSHYKKTRLLYEQNLKEILAIDTERTILKAQKDQLARRGKEQSQEMLMLQQKLAELTNKTEELESKISKFNIVRRGDEKKLGSISILWDGTISIRNQIVKFENTKQARILIEHLIRNACLGKNSIHCCWGYSLFGWKADSISSHPQRLFEIMSAKINSSLKRYGAPPIIKKCAKGSHHWKLAWNLEYLLPQCDIYRAFKNHDMFIGEIFEENISIIAQTLKFDPINISALSAIHNNIGLINMSSAYKNKLKSLLCSGETILSQRIATLNNGIKELENIILKGSMPKGMDWADIDDELSNMKQLIQIMGYGKNTNVKSPTKVTEISIANTIKKKMIDIHDEITSAKSSQVSEIDIWAMTVNSDDFLRLMTIPQINSLTNNFYNEEIKEKENPNLVQLALISALSKKDSLDYICRESKLSLMVDNIAKCIKKEVNKLSSSIEIASVA